MAEIDEIVQVDITVSDRVPERPNFGVPLIASFHSRWGDRVREYSAADDLLDDGFTTSSPEYLAAQAIKSQEETVQRFKIGRLTGSFTHTLHWIPTILTPGYVYEGTLNGVPYSYTVDDEDTVALVCTGVAASMGALATATTTHVTIAAATAGALLALKPRDDGRTRVLDATVVNGSTLTADLAAINDEDPDWYGLCLTLNTEDSIAAAAAWVEANGKVCFAHTPDWNVADVSETGDLATALVSGAFTRTALLWHRNVGEYASAAFLARFLAPDPGVATPAFKTLAGITVDRLRPGERSALTAKRVTRYTRVGGLNITFEGRTPSGRFIDVVRSIDWIKSEIQLDLYGALYSNPRIPYETGGLAVVRSCVENSIRKGLGTVVARDTPIVVTVPTIDQTSTSDRGNRILRGVEFDFRLSSALHGVRVTGRVSI